MLYVCIVSNQADIHPLFRLGFSLVYINQADVHPLFRLGFSLVYILF